MTTKPKKKSVKKSSKPAKVAKKAVKKPAKKTKGRTLLPTLIAVVLDRSGSMATVRDATVEAFNGFVKDQRKAPGVATLTLAQFDNVYEVVYANKPLAEVPPLEFEPRGYTALLDAIGRTVKEVDAQVEAAVVKPNVVLVVQTDGGENASLEFSRDQIAVLLGEKRLAGWQVLFLGANQDAIQAGGSMGFAPGQSLTYVANPVGTAQMFNTVSNSLRSYRSGDVANMQFTQEDRDANDAAQPPVVSNAIVNPTAPSSTGKN